MTHKLIGRLSRSLKIIADYARYVDEYEQEKLAIDVGKLIDELRR